MTESDGCRDGAADDGAQGRPEPLRGLHHADRLRDAIPGRRLRCHRETQRAVPGKQALDGTKGEHMPGLRDPGHRGHDHDEARERARDQKLASEPVRQASPTRRQQCGNRGGDAEGKAGPERDGADVAHAELRDVEREERHDEREAGEADEAGGGERREVAAPGENRTAARGRAGAGPLHAGRHAPPQNRIFTSSASLT